MDADSLALEIAILEQRCAMYEQKYGVSSEAFYRALFSGQLTEYDEHDETRADFTSWKGVYETLLRRKQLNIIENNIM
jgi:hypothetical protein